MPTARRAVQEAAERPLETEGGRGGGGSLIIHQPGCQNAIWGVTRPGKASCDAGGFV